MMSYREAKINSVRYASINGKWVTILKRTDADEYFPIYMSASQANIIKRELVAGRFRDVKGYELFLLGKEVTGYNLESLKIDEIDGSVCAKLTYSNDANKMELECPVAGAIALAFRRRASIFVGESCFYSTIPTDVPLASKS